ncbi:MAG: hypothetical protein ACI31S_04280 [Bacilli bacterium]
MEKYTFYHNQNKINEEIFLSYNGDFILLGNIYNVIDYINNNCLDNDIITFVNFKGNQIDYIISKILNFKDIVTVLDYNSILINKKRRKIRGRSYDKMDRRTEGSYI